MAISIQNHQKKAKIDLRRLRRALKKLLLHVDCADSDISLLLTDDDEITGINERYLGRNYPTNVISFSFLEGEYSGINPGLLGDVVISVETALRDAEKGGIPLEDELDFLLIHGLLHILGYDHEHPDPDRTQEMQKKEQELFFLLHGYPLDL
ncbi:MAG: Endoribonuclease YbeY [Syntrophus sp. PtaU1.Bin005]|jgi:probable rRNA maturation factor|uniref:rRNA maturation RNase YbeY n=1 Tax=Syntrophus TaxID=43773 RepID=UPI0009C68643|nr:MAG: Endoribonuclease YbeY [Syntrophus sp. PtaB.Bin138]OPY83492.1 MAG: Endoribonuclease YbeY [Syntrophus sp. PtaU1.Bin005]